MKKLLTLLLMFGLAVPTLAGEGRPDEPTKGARPYDEPELAANPSDAVVSATEVKPVEKIMLTSKNVLSLRGAVTWDSVSELQKEAIELSSKLDEDEIIYLVLDSPGGLISAGELLITTLKALPQEIKTITLFSASMADVIVQALGERLVVPNGEFMAHRAAGGLRGQFDGEIESRLAHYKRMFNQIETRNASRIGVDLATYKNLIVKEFWTHGTYAVEKNVADRVVNVTCSKKLINGKVKKTVRGFFRSYTLTFSECPLITTPINPNSNRDEDEGEFSKVLDNFDRNDYRNNAQDNDFIFTMFNDKRTFIKKYLPLIITD